MTEAGSGAPARRHDVFWAVAVAVVAFGVYLATLAPGMVALVDTPMFQFVGRVLGVAHNPGYPLFVLLTHPFSYLPIGSLAYRINLFSALCGALTVALVFLVARRLDCRRTVSAAAALAMGFGHVFWSQSIVAEVYTLDTALIAGLVLALLAWGETGRPSLYFTALALLAAGLGNHTTIVAFGVGIGLYASIEHRRFLTRPKHLAITFAILLGGLSQYLFILVRSRRPQAYLESSAHTLPELLHVMSGEQFGDRLFAFSGREVFTERLPWMVTQLLVPELTLPGLLLATMGIVYLLRRKVASALLLLSGAVAVSAFALNYAVVDLPVFLIPATLVLWIASAVGGERAVRMMPRVSGVPMAASLLLLLLPAWQLARNYEVTDRSRDTRTATTFDRLFDHMPDRSGLVREDFLVDRMVMYKVLGEPAAHQPAVALVEQDEQAVRLWLDGGGPLHAFPKSANRLRYHAFDVPFAPMPLLDDVLPAVLSRLPEGKIVAVAVPASMRTAFSRAAGALDAIGVGGDVLAQSPMSLVMVGITGERDGALVANVPDDRDVAVALGHVIGATGLVSPVAAELRSTRTEAAIRFGGRDIVRSGAGVVLAIWSATGQLEQAAVAQAVDEFRVPIPQGPLSVYPVRGPAPTHIVERSWTQVTGAAQTGTVVVRLPGQASLVAYVSSDEPLAPRVFDRSSPDVHVSVETDVGVPEVGESAPTTAPFVYRIDVETTTGASGAVVLALGGLPRDVVARIEHGEAAMMSEVDTAGLLRTPDRGSEVLLFARDDQRQLAGSGWSAVDADEASPFRWMVEPQARFVLPAVNAAASAVRVQALRRVAEGPRELRLIVNTRDLGSVTLKDGWQSYTWPLPAGVLMPHTNVVTLEVDALPDGGAENAPRAFAVSEVSLVAAY